ncbi:catalase family peroxidase [Rhodanobacter sp. AS-Z3]|uniref:catalase family peroxidase n=1 Tax=Rhodanobacter sp. AS-Z3 TaxID=3031330 RepID=UPI00247871BB|nr:catalase family peroxidase [Rhodanobacter sp. AS-Z3]WEN15707.1 catalase family peroxidase [Rhodanobacter sp. AS-Z3]
MPDLETTPSSNHHRAWPALLAIALIVAAVALAFAWIAGWLAPNRLTPQRFTNAIEIGNGQIYRGYRRAHAKGVCVAGYFEGNGQGAALSSARLFAAGRTPFVGRLSVGGGSPYGLDNKARVRSMALELNSDDGQQWRMAMNSFPFFGVSSVQAFYEQTVANAPAPATGKPDPAKQAAFAQAHPEFARFANWAKTAPWSTSWANTTFNGVNTFRFTNRAGETRNVRWSMQPQTPFVAMTAEQRAAVDGNFLSEDLVGRLGQGPLRWDMVVTLAQPGDSTVDPSQSWPEDRRRVTVGTVVIERSTPQTTGACRDINYDPLVLPAGVQGSDDPILAARSAVYSVSFNRREHDIASGSAGAATGKATAAEAKP